MFVAMNRITCIEEYKERFESLLTTRVREVDKESGFIQAQILRPVTQKGGSTYIVMTYWERQEDFHRWVKTGAFHRGHERGFADIQKARQEGKPVPMTSEMETYEVFAS
jgi:heme oxygenase (mycobilin-producing)